MGGGTFVQVKALIVIASNWTFDGLQELRNGSFRSDLSARNCDKKLRILLILTAQLKENGFSSNDFGKSLHQRKKSLRSWGAKKCSY